MVPLEINDKRISNKCEQSKKCENSWQNVFDKEKNVSVAVKIYFKSLADEM